MFVLSSIKFRRKSLWRYGAKIVITITNPFWTEKSNIVLMRRPNSESGSFTQLLLIPKAQEAMTSMVNLAIVSFTSTVEPDDSPWYCYYQDFQLLILKFKKNSYFVALIANFLSTSNHRVLNNSVSADATDLPKRQHQPCVVLLYFMERF